jgi:hypothetical protein
MPDHPQWLWKYVLEAEAVAIVLDERAQAAITRRRARGKDARLVLRVERLSPKTGFPNVADIGWASRRRPARELVVCHVEDVEVHADRRLVRYAGWRDVVVSAWRLGPVERLVLADPYLMLRVVDWEYARARAALPAGERPTEQSPIDGARRVSIGVGSRHVRREADDP